MSSRTLDPGGQANRLGPALRRRRDELQLSLRETARRIGISPGYLVALEHGRNPSTGRAPMPSPPILAAIGRVLGVDLATLLDLAGVPSPHHAHLLLYQTGSASRSPAAAARHLFAGRVDSWIEIAEPRRHDPEQRLAALADALAAAPRSGGRPRLGMLFGARSSVLRSIADPAALLATEATWEHDVAAVCRAATGSDPAANVCAYRDADIRERADHLDTLALTLGLVRTHPRVAVEDRDGTVVTGSQAIEAILQRARPAGISSSTWAALAAAAAAGLNRGEVVAPGR